MNDIGQQTLPPFRRLAISDLLLLTLTVAVAFGALGHDYRVAFKQFGSNGVALVLVLLDYFSSAVLIFTLLTLGYARLCGRTWQITPGHWLALTTGPVAACGVILTAIRPLVTADSLVPDAWRRACEGSVFIAVLLGTMLLGLLAWRSLANRWRFVFAAVLLLQVSLVTWFAVDTLFALDMLIISRIHILSGLIHSELLVLLGILIAAGTDIFLGLRRDWLHYTACLAVGVGSAARAINMNSVLIRWWQDFLNYLF